MTRFAVKLALFLLLGFAVTEAAFRIALGRRTAWYAAAAATVKQAPVDYIFAGTSRVAASIDEARFADVMSERSGKPVRALNMGMGFGSLADHYFGLRGLFEASARNLRGVTVFIEAPMGLPMGETWRDRWVISGGSPDLFVPYINAGDLARFWRLSGDDVFEKIYLTAAKYLMVVRKGGAVRNKIKVTGDRITDAALAKAGFASRAAPAADLIPAGGIRIEESDLAFVRKAALRNFENEMRDQRPIRNWDQSVLRSIVEMVEAHGGRVVLFDLPLNSLQSKPLSTGLRKSDRDNFQHVAGTWGIPILETAFPTEDSDYPDAWHLRRSLAAPFSASLAKAYGAYLEAKAAGESSPVTAAAFGITPSKTVARSPN